MNCFGGFSIGKVKVYPGNMTQHYRSITKKLNKSFFFESKRIAHYERQLRQCLPQIEDMQAFKEVLFDRFKFKAALFQTT